jgi:hypothetical protein
MKTLENLKTVFQNSIGGVRGSEGFSHGKIRLEASIAWRSPGLRMDV